MLKNIFKITIILFLAILQIALMPFLSIKGVWPNLIMIITIILILLDLSPEAFLMAFLGGLILDLASPLFFGFNILMILAVTYLIKLFVNKFITESNILIVAILIFIVAIIQDLTTMIVARNFIFMPLLINGLYSALIGLIFYQILDRWPKKTFPIKMVIK